MGVTQNACFLLLTHIRQLLFMACCDTTVSILAGFQTQYGQRKDTGVKVEIVV